MTRKNELLFNVHKDSWRFASSISVFKLVKSGHEHTHKTLS